MRAHAVVELPGAVTIPAKRLIAGRPAFAAQATKYRLVFSARAASRSAIFSSVVVGVIDSEKPILSLATALADSAVGFDSLVSEFVPGAAIDFIPVFRVLSLMSRGSFFFG
jgi:hypothetical protein